MISRLVRSRPLLTSFIVALGLALAVVGCRRAAPAPRRLLLLGIDAATMTVMEPMVARGELPTFARFFREGAHGRLRTIEPTLSVVIWTSILTGASPAEHGIHGWMSESGEQMAFSSDRIQRPPLWRILSAAHQRSLFVNFWASWPSEEVEGGMVSNRMRFRGLPYRAFPNDLMVVLDRVPEPAAKPATPVPGDDLADKRFYQEDRYALDLAAEAMGRVAPRVLAIYLRGLDVAQHSYWHTVDPTALRLDSALSDRPIVAEYYRFLDRELAQLLARMHDPTVVVVSDHGTEALREVPAQVEGLRFNRVLATLGYLAFEPLPPHKPGSGPIPRVVHWAGTVAYTFGDSAPDLDRGVRVNLKGRDPDGIVPAAERDALVDFLLVDLKALRTPDGRPLVTCASRVAEPAAGDPDLTVDLNPAITWDDKLLRGGEVVPVRSFGQPALAHNSGQHWHAPPGIILMMGDGVRSGVTLRDASVFDVAPTVLALLSLPAGADMVGRPLEEALAERPRPPIPSYRELAYRGPRAVEDEEVGRSTYEELRGLGYVQ